MKKSTPIELDEIDDELTEENMDDFFEDIKVSTNMSARRRLDDYLEMKRAKKQINDYYDF